MTHNVRNPPGLPFVKPKYERIKIICCYYIDLIIWTTTLTLIAFDIIITFDNHEMFCFNFFLQHHPSVRY